MIRRSRLPSVRLTRACGLEANILEDRANTALMVDRAGRVCWMAPTAARVLGPCSQQLIGRDWRESLAADDVSVATAAFEQVMAEGNGACASEVRLRVGPEEYRWFMVTIVGLPDVATGGRAVLVVHDMQDTLGQVEQLRYLASHDHLTGLVNRAQMSDRIANALQRAQRSGRSVSVLFIDLDGFKTINDALGHEAGDDVLRTVAFRLASSVRSGDTVARLGGDEFVILIEDDDALKLANRLLEIVGDPILIDGQSLWVTASIGIASGTRDTPRQLLRDADVALSLAKSRGKNQVSEFPAPAVPAPGLKRPAGRAPAIKAPGDQASGDTVSGDTVSGDTVSAITASAIKAPGDTAPGDTARGDTAPGDTAPGGEALGDEAPGGEALGDEAPGGGALGDAVAVPMALAGPGSPLG